MTKHDCILPTTPRTNGPCRVIFLIEDGFDLLDLAGPMAVFEAANTLAEDVLYETILASMSGGGTTTHTHVQVQSICAVDVTVRQCDTVLSVGAGRLPSAESLRASGLVDWVRQAAQTSARMGAICVGAFVLADAGVLDGRCVTTHWAACDALASRAPTADVLSDQLYVHDDGVWTSAGITAGIDLALAILEQDHGAKLMAEVARHMVVYARRPGHQSQFSPLLDMQMAKSGVLSDLVVWIDLNLDRPLRIEDLAERVGLTERSFFRKFEQTFKITPARFIESRRVERACQLLQQGMAVKAICPAVGFRSEAAFRKAFERRLGMSPSRYKALNV